MKKLIMLLALLLLLTARCGREVPESFVAVPTPTPAATAVPGDSGNLPNAGN